MPKSRTLHAFPCTQKVNKQHTLIMYRWESNENRRIKEGRINSKCHRRRSKLREKWRAHRLQSCTPAALAGIYALKFPPAMLQPNKSCGETERSRQINGGPTSLVSLRFWQYFVMLIWEIQLSKPISMANQN
jgi:hypothetical protein